MQSTSRFQNLLKLMVRGCGNIKYLLSFSTAKFMVHLKYLSIVECKAMEEILLTEDSGVVEEIIPQLENLVLKELPILERFCQGSNIKFPSLKKLEIDNCPKLKTFISKPVSLGMMTSCKELKEMNAEQSPHTAMQPLFNEEVVFPNLETLQLSSIGLEGIQHNQHRAAWSSCRLGMQSTSRFQNLLELTVNGCDNIKYLLSFSTAEFMVQLKGLQISECKAMEEILITEDLEVVEEIIPKVLFPRLEALVLKELPLLERFCQGSNIKFPSLEILVLDHCPKLKTFIFKPVSSCMTTSKELKEMNTKESPHTVVQPLFNEEVAFPSLERLLISHVDDLKIMWQNQFAIDSFYKLRVLKVLFCKNLVNVFQSDMLARFQSLEELFVEDCGSLEEVFELEGLNVTETHALTIIQLKVLYLKALPNMRHVWSKEPKKIFSFQKLQRVHVEGCSSLKSLFPASVATCLTQLEDLGVVEEIIPKVLFPRLEGLVLKELPILDRFCQGSNIKFPSLKSLVLDHCPKLKTFIFKPVSSCMTTSKELKEMNTEESHHTAVQPFFNEEVAFPCLETLVICHMDDLKIIWRNQFAMSLEELLVRDCDSLQALYELQGQNVTEAHAVTGIRLKKLYLCRLPKMKHVWNKDPQEIFSIQNLKDLRVIECESLKSLFPASVARCLTQLEDLYIVDCGVLEEIVAGEEGAEAITRFVFPQVSHLHLDRLPRLKCFYPGRHASEWPMLKDMYVDGCHEVDIFASQLLSETLEETQLEISVKQPLFFVDEVAFPSLENLRISHMNNLKIIWRNQFAVDSFYKLQGLRVEFCENLVNIFQSDMLTRFRSLETLHVKKCGSLQAVFELEGLNVTETHDVTAIQLKGLYLVDLPNMRHVWSKDPKPIFSFQNLGTVFLLRCRRLKSLFPASVATCLPQLERLVMVSCGAEEIVAGEEAEQPILEEIVAGEEAEQPIARFVFPQVTVLHLALLPRLKWFYRGVHTSEWPMLKDVLVAGCPEVEIFASELSSFQDILRLEIPTKQPLFLVHEVPFPSLEKLRISYMPDLKIIWHNQFTADSFCEPQIIKVEFCENLIVQETCAVPATQLKELHLIHLPKLNHIWNKYPQQIFSFAMGCESMESLFPEIQGVEIDDHWGVEKIVLRNQNSSESYPSRVNTSE